MSDPTAIGSKAQMPNPALQKFGFLIGSWRTTGSHPEIAEMSLVGRTSFSWVADGAYLLMRTEVDHSQFPNSIAVIGSDDGQGRFVMAYFDERGVSRLYEVTVGDGAVTWHREDTKLSQSNTITVSAEGDRLISHGRMSQNGGAWGNDLSQVLNREGVPDLTHIDADAKQ
jgi:hypothetical protein